MALLACDNAERYRLGSGGIDSLADRDSFSRLQRTYQDMEDVQKLYPYNLVSLLDLYGG